MGTVSQGPRGWANQAPLSLIGEQGSRNGSYFVQVDPMSGYDSDPNDKRKRPKGLRAVTSNFYRIAVAVGVTISLCIMYLGNPKIIVNEVAKWTMGRTYDGIVLWESKLSASCLSCVEGKTTWYVEHERKELSYARHISAAECSETEGFVSEIICDEGDRASLQATLAALKRVGIPGPHGYTTFGFFWAAPSLSDDSSWELDPNEVSLVSHLSYGRLPYLPTLLGQWDGPASISVFLSTGAQIEKANEFLTKLREKEPQLLQMTDIHLVLDYWGLSEDNSGWSYWDNSAGTQRRYPVNHLRNEAYRRIRTNLFAVVDGGVWLMKGMSKYLRNMKLADTSISLPLRSRGSSSSGSQQWSPHCKSVFIIPSFQIKDMSDATLYASLQKSSLLQEIDRGTIAPTCYGLCDGHHNTNYTAWAQLPADADPYRVEYSWSYQPWFVASIDDFPPYDPNFRGWGLDRLSHALELSKEGYEFHVLPGTFLIHHRLTKNTVYAEAQLQDRRPITPSWNRYLGVNAHEFDSRFSKRMEAWYPPTWANDKSVQDFNISTKRIKLAERDRIGHRIDIALDRREQSLNKDVRYIHGGFMERLLDVPHWGERFESSIRLDAVLESWAFIHSLVLNDMGPPRYVIHRNSIAREWVNVTDDSSLSGGGWRNSTLSLRLVDGVESSILVPFLYSLVTGRAMLLLHSSLEDPQRIVCSNVFHIMDEYKRSKKKNHISLEEDKDVKPLAVCKDLLHSNGPLSSATVHFSNESADGIFTEANAANVIVSDAEGMKVEDISDILEQICGSDFYGQGFRSLFPGQNPACDRVVTHLQPLFMNFLNSYQEWVSS